MIIFLIIMNTIILQFSLLSSIDDGFVISLITDEIIKFIKILEDTKQVKELTSLVVSHVVVSEIAYILIPNLDEVLQTRLIEHLAILVVAVILNKYYWIPFTKFVKKQLNKLKTYLNKKITSIIDGSYKLDEGFTVFVKDIASSVIFKISRIILKTLSLYHKIKENTRRIVWELVFHSFYFIQFMILSLMYSYVIFMIIFKLIMVFS